MAQPDPSRIEGCILGAALGDALGAPFEFRQPEDVLQRNGDAWIRQLRPCLPNSTHPHGYWAQDPPLGVGTDDTRYNWLILNLADEIGRVPTAPQVARRMLEVFEEPARFFPRHRQIAREQFSAWAPMARGFLGLADPDRPDVPPGVLLDGNLGGINFPNLLGLITFTCLGSLRPGDAEGAYRAAYVADFFDIGYAKEAVGLLAAAVSQAVVAGARPAEVIPAVCGLDPFALGGCFGGPYIKQHIGKVLQDAAGKAGPQLAEHLSRCFRNIHPFDPFLALSVAFASVLAHPQDPQAAMQVAANIRAFRDDGTLGEYMDIDCYACVTGALAGAFCGRQALEEDSLAHVIRADLEVYGIDLPQLAAKALRLAMR
jgi:hypothetical protein